MICCLGNRPVFRKGHGVFYFTLDAEHGVMIQFATVMNNKRKQEGLRTRFRSMLDPDRIKWPRRFKSLSTKDKNDIRKKRTVLNHPVSWYTDGHLVSRPMNGAYALAMFAEWCLAKVKAGDGGDLAETMAFYADTRRFLEMILCNRKAGRSLTPKQRRGMEPRVASLVEQARSVSSKFKR